jgi:putative ABC transport system ATP-binding protein
MIQISNLKKEFHYGGVYTVALGGINLDIEEGEFVAIMGPSGCGKTTLLNIIGLLDNPSEGSYLLNGSEVAHLTEKKRTAMRKGNIGFVFQSFNLIAALNVEKNVELPLK